MDVEYFPFDEQTCVMKFGSWTYDGFQVDLRHQDALEKNKDERVRVKSDKEVRAPDIVEIGMDLTEFYKSVEWDILGVPASRNVKFYTCCDEPYLDITFNITMRRKTLFYTVNLIIPCMGISFLTVLVFYLPSDSGEKISLSVSILLTLTVFFLLLAEIIPPTSLVVPLLGKFVLFTMILDTFSICVTVVVLNVHFRSPQTHSMPPWVRRVFIHLLPRLLSIERPSKDIKGILKPAGLLQNQMKISCNGLKHQTAALDTSPFLGTGVPQSSHRLPLSHSHRNCDTVRAPSDRSRCRIHGYKTESTEDWAKNFVDPIATRENKENLLTKHSDDDERSSPAYSSRSSSALENCPELIRAMEGVKYIAECAKQEEDTEKVKEDWKFVAMVMDRMFLWIFTVAVIVGTAGIILQAPTLYDTRPAIDELLSEIEAVSIRKPGDLHGSQTPD
eukprot:TRINITY_DN12536_c0_g1_i1.p1 TRINITY_DN12536_c0_g1~~TRINITY_DN12536_c0_g1_i1.p1  ORF type:complete len:457 (-),score=107.08 TRINITY_DN12536_c0_g1_i1:430-1767(-)